MSVVESLTLRCTQVSGTLVTVGQHLSAARRIVDDRNDAAAQDDRGAFGHELNPVFVRAQPRIHAAGRKIDMAVAMLDTVEHVIRGLAAEPSIDDILDRLDAAKVSLTQLAADLSSCQADLDHITGALSYRLEDDRPGRSVLDECERAQETLIAARVQFAELCDEQAQLIRDTAGDDAADPASTSRPRGRTAHRAVSSVTELMSLGQNLSTTLELAQTCVALAAATARKWLATARDAGYPSVVERWEAIDGDLTGVQGEITAAIEGVSVVVMTLENVPVLDTVADVKAAFAANQVQLTALSSQLGSAAKTVVTAGASISLSRNRHPYRRIKAKLGQASTATHTAVMELEQFIELNRELVVQL